MVCSLEHLLFSIIYGIILPIDFYMFQRGRPTINQYHITIILFISLYTIITILPYYHHYYHITIITIIPITKMMVYYYHIAIIPIHYYHIAILPSYYYHITNCHLLKEIPVAIATLRLAIPWGLQGAWLIPGVKVIGFCSVGIHFVIGIPTMIVS